MDETSLSHIRALLEPVLTARGMELVELAIRPQGGQQLIRCLVDKVGGVTIQQCAETNRCIGEALEGSTLMPKSYTVEVSSPGLDRPLATKRDFERALGENLRVDTNMKDGRTREYRGMLLAVQPEAIVLKLTAGTVTVPLADIRTAKKAIRW